MCVCVCVISSVGENYKRSKFELIRHESSRSVDTVSYTHLTLPTRRTV